MQTAPSQLIIHVDMDAFYAAVEVRDDPSLRGKPLIIGSMPDERGVVSTASYEARTYGVRSGMNIKEAYALCPQGIYRHPDFHKYKAVSQALHGIWSSYASAAEYIALDEAFLDVTETAGSFERACEFAHEIKERTFQEQHLTCSVGVAYSKTAAKTASEEKKPDGYFEIPTREDYVRLIIDRPVRVLYGVGEKTAERMKDAGLRTVRDIQENRESVVLMFGKMGEWAVDLAFGNDDRKVVPYRAEDAKSVSRELTYQEDTDRWDLVRHTILLLSVDVARRAARHELYGGGVTLKITYSDMKTITRSVMAEHVKDPVVIYREALRMLEKIPRRPVRLVGVGMNRVEKEGTRQFTFEDYIEDIGARRAEELREEFGRLSTLYGFDFYANREKIFQGENVYRTVEYMRKKQG